jgi:endonuclease-3
MEIGRIVKALKKRYKWKRGHSSDPFEVLISTVLSQRTKDANTEKASSALFSRFKTPRELANADIGRIEKLIRASGFYKVKAKRIKEISRIIVEKFGGKVPGRMDELLSLPGVGRKTANCVLVFAYRQPAIPVDTHVHRISNRLGIVKTKTPEKTETELMRRIPRRYWIDLNELLVTHGQNICLPRKPHCSICPIKKYCKKVGVTAFL